MSAWRRFICSITHHLWEMPVKHTDWYKYVEEIGPGYYLEPVSATSEDKDAWSDEYETRTCAYCGIKELL